MHTASSVVESDEEQARATKAKKTSAIGLITGPVSLRRARSQSRPDGRSRMTARPKPSATRRTQSYEDASCPTMNHRAHAGALALAVAACAPARVVLHAQPVEQGDIHVSPLEAALRGDKLSLKLAVQNRSDATLVIRPDRVVVRLPTGHTVTRAMGMPYGEGMWGSYYGGGGWVTHDPDVLPPGGTRVVDVEYEELGFEWTDFAKVEVDFDGAITRDSQPVVVPALVVSR
jgi:hypothetical protein